MWRFSTRIEDENYNVFSSIKTHFSTLVLIRTQCIDSKLLIDDPSVPQQILNIVCACTFYATKKAFYHPRFSHGRLPDGTDFDFILSPVPWKLLWLAPTLRGGRAELGAVVRFRLTWRWQLGAVLACSLIKRSWATAHLWWERGGGLAGCRSMPHSHFCSSSLSRGKGGITPRYLRRAGKRDTL